MLQLALVAVLAQNALPRPTASGSIQGMVVKGGTGEPLAKAMVEVRGDDESAPLVSATTTESDGRFLFRNVRPGRYRLVALRSGYVRRPLSVTVGQGQTPDVQVVMTATGAISGRIYGGNGEPLGNVDVQALKPSYQQGRRVLTSVQSMRSNDRGEYRLFWLAPAQYYVRAIHPDAQTVMGRMMGNFAGSFGIGGFGGPGGLNMVRGTGDAALDVRGLGPFSTDEQQTERYVPVYFPGTVGEQSASAIDLRAGADVGGVDIPLNPVRSRHLRGVVINGATGQVAQYAGLKIVGADDPFPGGPAGGLDGSGGAAINPDGSFDLTLFPGSYTLMGTAGTGVGYASLDVRDADVDGIQIVAMPAFDIAGRIVTDGPADSAGLANLRISLRRELLLPATPSPSYSVPRPDGSFVVEATPGDYRVNVAPLLTLAPPFLSVPKGLEHAYVKSIRLGNVDVLNGGVRLERPPASSLEIVIGTNLAALEGSVLKEGQAAAAGGTVVLLPDVRSRTDLYRTTTTDPVGRFHLDHIPPGDYKAFAWEDVNDGAWQDPEFLRANENRGTPIRIGEGSTETVRLTLIQQ